MFNITFRWLSCVKELYITSACNILVFKLKTTIRNFQGKTRMSKETGFAVKVAIHHSITVGYPDDITL